MDDGQRTDSDHYTAYLSKAQVKEKTQNISMFLGQSYKMEFIN